MKPKTLNNPLKLITPLLLLAILFSSGCVSIELEQRIDSEGKAFTTTRIDFSKFAEIEKTMSQDLNLGEGMVIQEPAVLDLNTQLKEMCTEFSAQTKLKNSSCRTEGYTVITSGETTLGEPAFKKRKSLLYTYYEYNAIEALESLEGVSELTDSQEVDVTNAEDASKSSAMLELMGIELSYSLEMPGTIVESSAGTISGNKIDLGFDDLIGKKDLYVKSRELKPQIALMSLAFAALVGAGIAVFILRKK